MESWNSLITFLNLINKFHDLNFFEIPRIHQEILQNTCEQFNFNFHSPRQQKKRKNQTFTGLDKFNSQTLIHRKMLNVR
jgi:hypothetical protein